MKKILFILLIIFFNIKVYADDKMDLGLEVFNNKAIAYYAFNSTNK